MVETRLRKESPESRSEAAEIMRASAEQGRTLRPVGGGTKLDWGAAAARRDLDLSTENLDRILEHNEGDLTAVLEAGVPLSRAQETFAGAGQMLALDPHLGNAGEATIGGILASGDSGPLRHRYGAARDLVIGVTVVLSDGTVAKAGGKVIKNVAGYDLAKLFTGSFGTLGLIAEVAVRLHPLAKTTASVIGVADDPNVLAGAASALAHAPLDLDCLDVRWEDGAGSVLARFGGAAAAGQARNALSVLADNGIGGRLEEEDDSLWERQRAGQRTRDGTVVRISGVQAGLPRVLRAAERVGASLVGRAALGLSWLTLSGGDAEETAALVEDVRRELAPFPCVVLDAPPHVRGSVDAWGEADGPGIELMRRVKLRFDPTGTYNPGIFVGGI